VSRAQSGGEDLHERSHVRSNVLTFALLAVVLSASDLLCHVNQLPSHAALVGGAAIASVAATRQQLAARIVDQPATGVAASAHRWIAAAAVAAACTEPVRFAAAVTGSHSLRSRASVGQSEQWWQQWT
jgi:hypothetical protein